MPYRHAHWWIVGLVPLIMLAFWPGYLSTIGSAPLQFHIHGITASIWLALLALQSWSIHHDHMSLHRLSGRSSLAVFQLFMAGGAGIFLGMAQRYVEGNPFQAMYAPRLAWLDVIGVAGFAFCYFQALKWRRKAHFHSRYMLATLFFLLPPIFGRLAGIPLGVRGPEDFARLTYGFQAANLLAAAIPLWLAFRAPRHGRPFVHAAGFILLSAILYQTVGTWPAWERLVAGVSTIPMIPFVIAAMLGGVGIAWAGWVAGKKPVVPAAALPA